MKTQSSKDLRRFQLKIASYDNYIDRIEKLERLLARTPRAVQIEMIGTGEIPADSALLLRSVLLARSEKTRVITNARSSLQNSSVLVWLLGDSRVIRDDARLYFRRSQLSEEEDVEQSEVWKEKDPQYRDSFSDIDPEEGDYARVLQLINEFLPVKELAGRLIGTPLLRQFGLIENEKVDHFLADVFSKKSDPADKPPSLSDVKRSRNAAAIRAPAKMKS